MQLSSLLNRQNLFVYYKVSPVFAKAFYIISTYFTRKSQVILVIKVTLLFLVMGIGQKSLGQTSFITRWNLATAGSGATQLSFGTATSGTVSYNWEELSPGSATGSGSFSGNTLTINGLPTAATIRLKIDPTNFQRIIINNATDKSRLLDVEQWGSTVWTSMVNAFMGCNNLNITATDTPVLTSSYSMAQLFSGCTTLNGPANINSWNTNAVNNMSRMFNSATFFNQVTGGFGNVNAKRTNTVTANNIVGNAILGIANGAILTMSDSDTLTLTYLSNAGTITANASTLSIGGTFTNTGTFDANTGTVIYSGATATIAATTYYNLQVSTAGAKTLAGNTTVSGVATINTGSELALGANTLTLSGTGTPLLNSGGTFTANTGTVNYNGNGAQTVAGVTYNNLTLSGSGVKTAPSTITILGNLSRSGTHSFAAGTGRVSFAGTAQQVYSATGGTTPIEFYDVANTNTVGLRLDATIGIQNELNLSSTAILNLNTGDIILRSTNTRTAYVTDLGTTGASTNITYGTGRFNIERYLPSVRSWRLLAAPILSEGLTITDAWREGGSSLVSTGYGTQIAGPATSIGMDAVSPRGSMKWYNKETNSYTEITNTADAIARPQGYYVFVVGDRAQSGAGTGSATNLRMKGKILTGSQTFTALLQATTSNGFESVGNPYPSQINFKTVTKSNLEPTYTVWNPNGGYYGVGRFVQYVSTTGPNGDYQNGGNTVNTIESGQAFFIQSAAGNSAGSITIKESDKLTGSNTVSRPGVTVPTLEVNLHQVVGNSSTNFLDHVVLNFDGSYSNSFDGNDVRKFMNSTDNLAIKMDTRNLILERRTPLTTTDTIYLSLTNTRLASYQLKIDPSILDNLPLNAFLLDKFLVTETPVSLTAVTTVPFSITSDANSKIADRFTIVFREARVLPVTFTSIAALVNTDKTHTVRWFVSNELNLAGYVIERSGNGVRFDAIGNAAVAGTTAYSFIDASPLAGVNFYRVRATSANGQVQYSTIVKLSIADVKPGFSIQPNPVVNKTMHINFQKMEGLYSIRVTNKQGATVFAKQITLAAGSQVKDIELGEAVATGVYDVVLVDAKGKQTVQTVFVQ